MSKLNRLNHLIILDSQVQDQETLLNKRSPHSRVFTLNPHIFLNHQNLLTQKLEDKI
jgi:hypothetical protein